MRARGLSIVGAVVFGAIAGCGGSTSSGDGGSSGPPAPTNVPIDQVPGMLAQAACDVSTQCLGPEFAVFLGGVDCATYETKTLEAQGFSAIPMLVMQGKIAYDGTQVQPCLDALRMGGCGALQNEPDVCKKVFVGQTPTGGSCTVDEECADDGVCVGHGTCPGTCTARVAAGSPCTSTSACQHGLACSNATCVTPAAAGAACGGTNPDCAPGLACVGANPMKMTPGTCKSISDAFSAQMGAPCDLLGGQLCVEGAFCAIDSFGTSGLMSTCVGPSMAGGPCKVSLPESCPTGQYCNADLSKGMTSGTCVALPDDGQPCAQSGASKTGLCKPGSACDGGTCKAMQDVGGSCATDGVCYSKTCTNGTCAAQTSCSKP